MAYFGTSFYHQSLIPLAVVTAGLAWAARPSHSESAPANFVKFQAVYTAVWSICVAADWLQGPYVYALYSSYGYDSHTIAQLFVAGFGSSLVFSCFVGTMADRWGRKKCCLMYCVLYIISCLTKHCRLYWVLMLGRLTGGIATSILFSCFECWMVSEHMQRNNFSSGLLTYMFGVMYTVMYFVAIVSGLAAQAAADMFPLSPITQNSSVHFGGYTAPFDLAILCLCAGFALILFTWEENYGQHVQDQQDVAHGRDLWDTFRDALQMFSHSGGVFGLCVVVTGFESAMFAFVFNWTPALDSKEVPPPHGLIFALFMMACMCGSSVSTIASKWANPSSRLYSLLCLAVIAFLSASVAANMTGQIVTCFVAFMTFEFCVGCYFPAIGMLKSELVPERVRGTVYNIYRIPLNGVVVALLLSNMSIVSCFRLCAGLVSVALIAALTIPSSRTAELKTLRAV